jgi:hypothetical protein
MAPYKIEDFYDTKDEYLGGISLQDLKLLVENIQSTELSYPEKS